MEYFMLKCCVPLGVRILFSYDIDSTLLVTVYSVRLPESYFLLGVVVVEATQRQVTTVIYVGFCTPTLLECSLVQVFRSK